MRKYLAIIAAGLALLASPASADWTGKNAAGGTLTFSNAVDCTIGVCIPIAALVTAAGGTLYGTAGVSNTSVLSVQGIASGTALPVSLASVPSHAVTNAGTFLVQANGFTSWAGGTLGAMATYGTSPGAVLVPGVNAFVTNTLAPGQAAAASSSPVVLAKNSGTGSTVAGAAVGTAGTASTEVVTVQGIASMTPFLNNPGTPASWGIGATGAAVPANAAYFGFNSGGNLTAPAVATPLPVRQSDGTNVGQLDPCQSEVKSTLPITLATAAVKVIAVGVSAKKIYVCQIHLTNNAADSVAVFEATTATTCATSPVAVVGAGTTVATAATGYNFGANGGISLGSGSNQVLQTSVNANDLCIAQSAATQLTGSITYVTR